MPKKSKDDFRNDFESTDERRRESISDERSGTLSRRRFLGGVGAAAVAAAVGCKDRSPSGVDIDGGPDVHDDGGVDVDGGQTVPAKVQGLQQTNATSTSITYSWTGVDGAEGYRVYVDDVFVKDINRTFDTLSDLDASTSYSVEVAGYNFIGEGPKSDSVTMTTEAMEQTGDLSLVGDPNFNADSYANSLNSEQRLWYDRFMYAFWRDKDNNSPAEQYTSLANSDNLYYYARTLSTYTCGILSAFRVTGDLRILDDLDRLTQLMRSNLFDGDCDGSNEDGFLNWRYRRHPDSTHWCRDIHVMEEMMAHAHVAHFAYAFHLNRNNPSPGGVNYAERADFWLDYLINHFEAKWRERNNRAWPQMDFITRTLFHPQFKFIGYHYCMWKMTGLTEYKTYAEFLSDQYLDLPRIQNEQQGGFQEYPGAYGTNIAWSQSTPRTITNGDGWPGTAVDGVTGTYHRHTASFLQMLVMEGFYRWTPAVAEKLGNSVAEHFIDMDPNTIDSSTTFGPRITGSEPLCHYGWCYGSPADSSRLTLTRFVRQVNHATVAFMPEGAGKTRYMAGLQNAYSALESVDTPRGVFVPAAMLLESVCRHE